MNADEAVAFTKTLREKLDAWDHSNSSERMRFLLAFVMKFEGPGCMELDSEWAGGGSLLLARLMVWLQVGYMYRRHTDQLLRALGVFVMAPEGNRYAGEMIEGGLIITLLDIIMKQKFKDTEKIETIELLSKIAFRGRRYKEAICESHGVKVLCEFVAGTGWNVGGSEEESCAVETVRSWSESMEAAVPELGGEKEETDREELPCESKGQLWEELQQYRERHRGAAQQGQKETAQKAEQDEEEPQEQQRLLIPEPPDQQWDTLTSSKDSEEDLVLEAEILSDGKLEACSAVLHKARDLLVTLASGNPRYQLQIARVLLILLTSVNPWAQLVACQVLRQLLPHTKELCGEVVEPLLGLLGTNKIRLLYEGLQLMDIVVMSPHRRELLKGLLQLSEPQDKHPLYITEPDLSDFHEGYVGTASQRHIQADAILAIGHVLSAWTVEDVVELGTESALVASLGSMAHPESQRRAARVLRKLVSLSSVVGVRLAENFPPGLLTRIMLDPIEAAIKLSAADAKRLRVWARGTQSKESASQMPDP